MAENNISNKKETFRKLVSKGRIHDAIRLLRSVSEQNMTWEITDEVNKVDSSYSYLLQYAIDGVDDPQRNDIYNDLVSTLVITFDRLERYVNSKTGNSAYYTTVRRLHGTSVNGAVDAYMKALNSGDSFAQALSGDTDPQKSRLATESAEMNLFDRVWTCFPWSRDDFEAISKLISDGIVPEHVRQHLLSATMLGNLEYLDERRLVLLADTYSRFPDDPIGIIALTGLLISLYMNRDKTLSTPTLNRLNALKDIPSWKSDIKTIFLELIRTRDTERITRKMTDEIVPQMLRMKPEIEKKIADKKIGNVDINDLEENPEWQEMLDKSGIADKIKELTELQEEGSDVMLGTFAHLKSFPFFYNVANWFLPFYTDHSSVRATADGSDIIAELLTKSGFMCDSDKYSFMLVIGSVAKQQKDLMTSQLRAQNISAAEIQNSGLNLMSDNRRNIVNKYVQNLYRFFRLFRRKEDFTDPFSSEINLTQVALLADEFKDDTLNLVAEFYFKHKYYKEALDVFRIVETNSFPDAAHYQKMGYCEQRLGNIDNAIRYYEQSELIGAESLWTTKRLAACYRQAGDFAKALEYYRKLETVEPENALYASHIGSCLLALDRDAEAVKAFFKAYYLSGDSAKSLRKLAWAQFLAADFDHAAESYGKLIEGADTVAEDFLNAGHLSMARRDFRSAIDRYSVFVRMSANGYTDFINAMRADTASLLKTGVKPEMIPLVIDAVSYRVSD